VTNRTFDPVTSWLTLATAGVGGGAGLLNQTYSQDKNGNITQRQNSNLGLTENFFYDADQRLTCATLLSSCSSPTLVYDSGAAGPGNITSQTGVGTYTYPAAGSARPHAVTSLTGTFNGITNPSFSYDSNGNMSTRAGSTIAWSTYNYPTDISASDSTGTEDVQLSYGPDRQRWKQLYTAPGTTETTYYIGGSLEVVISGTVTNYRHYINAGNEPVAVYNRTSTGTNTMNYMLEDHQGGVANIASNSGSSVVNESFSAFGTRRNPSTWSGAPSTADLNTIAGVSRQGYTFQTWLGQSMGLNHMNGRVEDAILGRFLSPDRHVPDPSNSQSYNRYSYVNNNPLALTDPSGFDPFKRCTDDCPDNPGHKRNFSRSDPGSLGPTSNNTAAIADGMQGTDATYDWVGAVMTSSYDNLPTGSATIEPAGQGTTGGNDSSAGNDSPNANATDTQSQTAGNGCVGSPCEPSTQQMFDPRGFVAPAVGVGAAVGIAFGQAVIVIFGGFPASTASDDTTLDDNQSQAYVFHFTSQKNADGIILSGQINPSASQGVAWVTPTPYPNADLAQAQLALQNTPQGFFAIPAQNLQTPLSWSTVQPNAFGPGGGVEGTTPLPIPLNGPGGPAIWVPFRN
jgi:RHS repeat-associated protein